jgi:GT2 family glycosyltransferase
MGHNSEIFIVIPVHDRKNYTQNCLQSLKEQSKNSFSVIVVDDGSTDGTEDMIKDLFHETIILKGNGKLWWTAATNLGVKYALSNGAGYVLTLNNDTILSENYLENMLHWAARKPDALLGSLAFDFRTKQPIYGGEIVNWKKASSQFLLDTIAPGNLKGLYQVTHFLGRGLLIPSKVFERIGLFDEKHFPHYLADYDFTHRAARNGFELYCNYDAKLFVFPKESGDYELRSEKSLSNYILHLFSTRGGGNIRTFIFYAFKNCPRKYLLIFITKGLLKRIFGYPYYWLKERF